MGIMSKSKLPKRLAKGGSFWNKGSGSKAGTLHPAPLKKIGKKVPSKALIKRK